MGADDFSSTDSAIATEAAEYSDVLQLDIVEEYTAITLKVRAMFLKCSMFKSEIHFLAIMKLEFFNP